MRKFILPVLVGSIVIVAGCSKKNEEPVGFASAFVSQSTWTSSCSDSDRFGLTMDSEFSLSSGSFIKVNRYYSDGTCNDLAVQTSETGDVTYSAADSSTGSIDFSYDNIQVTPKNDAGILALNAVTFCGSNTWSLNDNRDVTQLSGGEACWERTPRTVHDIYRIDGDNLYFGAGSEREKGGSATRPTALDETRVWKIH